MPEELVTIAKFFSLGEAKVAQGRLSSEGISVFVCDEHMHAINWHMGAAFGGIRLQVPERQVVRALEILDGFEPEASEEEEETEEVPCCPECDSLEIREVSGTNSRQISLWSSAIPFPELPIQTTHHWKCLMCGYQWQEEGE
jgi:Putative prokaryotic signal transducing protein